MSKDPPVVDVTVKERKFKATGDKHWFDQLLPPKVPPHLKPFVAAAWRIRR
jgi:hypothetical protein